MSDAGWLIGWTPTRLSAISFGYDLRMRGRANRVKSAMFAVVVWSSRIMERRSGFQALNWFSRMLAMRPNLALGTSLHLLRTEAHLPTSWFFLDSWIMLALWRSVAAPAMAWRFSVR